MEPAAPVSYQATDEAMEPAAPRMEEPVVQPMETTDQPAAGEPPPPPEGFETFAKPEPPARPERVADETPSIELERPGSSLPVPDDETGEEEKVIDLYALGAVDYDPAVHG